MYQITIRPLKVNWAKTKQIEYNNKMATRNRKIPKNMNSAPKSTQMHHITHSCDLWFLIYSC